MLYNNQEIVLIEELLGLEVEHINRHLGTGIIVNSYIICDEGNYSNFIVDIKYGTSFEEQVDLIDYLKSGFLQMEEENLSLRDIIQLQDTVIGRLKADEESRLKELQEFNRICKLTRTKYEKSLLRDEAYRYLVEERRITELVHFTPVCNLRSILNQGILPRNSVAADVTCLDAERREGLPDFSCFSASFPNWAMFYKYRMQHHDLRFAVISISPEILQYKEYDEILFTQNNAASKKYHGSLLMHKGLSYAQSMFADYSYGESPSYRESVGLPVHYTTDAQAEILIQGQVCNQYIREVYFENEEDLITFSEDLTEQQQALLKVDSAYFQRRDDWKYYKLH